MERICTVLDVKLKVLLDFNEELIFKNINRNQQGGEFVAYNNTDIKQIEVLYKKLLAEKDKIISMLEKSYKENSP